jgi:hypothetical protein
MVYHQVLVKHGTLRGVFEFVNGLLIKVAEDSPSLSHATLLLYEHLRVFERIRAFLGHSVPDFLPELNSKLADMQANDFSHIIIK